MTMIMLVLVLVVAVMVIVTTDGLCLLGFTCGIMTMMMMMMVMMMMMMMMLLVMILMRLGAHKAQASGRTVKDDCSSGKPIRIRYSLAGEDTRLSPERPGFESQWRNFVEA